jgi:argininosuccinate synthase
MSIDQSKDNISNAGAVRSWRCGVGFSGGLDTSYCVKYLTDEKGYEVHSVIVNTGGFSEEELKQIEKHAYTLGVKTHTTVMR